MISSNYAVCTYSALTQERIRVGIAAEYFRQSTTRLLKEKLNVLPQLLLNKNQIFNYGFPVEMGDQVYIQPNEYQRDRELFYSDNDSTRVCTRCQSTFHVNTDGSQAITSSAAICQDIDGIQYNFHIHTQQPMKNLKLFKKAPKVNEFNGEMSGKLFAIDVESVYTSKGQEVGRVTMVDYLGTTLIDAIVKPENQIFDYVTKYSGLTPNHMQFATETLDSVRERIFDHINEESILVGHALNGDLKSLRILHSNVIDTSVLFESNRRRPSLQKLTSFHLKREIQNSAGGHCSKEDAVASLQLVYFGLMNPHLLSPFYQVSCSML
ncbi:hypothetical protein CRE_28166 [Caenorhabditis remanei]|uniref:Exonuclease domain-containing protein n=1 Tax=Caenorhabditis remanei TaxID=31234 RepID=E3LMN8_CAERE|nr:hypothetical protein CRE_28166 [Caenorhabditis remanei]